MSNTNAITSYFEFNGIRSSDYGIYVTATDIFTTAERSYEQISVPGRNGDIFKDNAHYNNVTVTYHCNIAADRWLGFDDKFYAWARAMTASTGYCDLTDSYRPGILRLGVLSSEIKPSAKGAGWTIGEFDVTFSCKPQIWIPAEFISNDIIPVIYSSSANTTGYIPLTPGSVVTLAFNSADAKLPSSGQLNVKFYDESKTLVRGSLVNRDRIVTINSTSESYFLTLSWSKNVVPEGTNITIFVAGEQRGKLFDSGAIIENKSNYDIYPTITLTRTDATMETEKKIELNGYTITVQPFSGTIAIDCEAMTITDGEGNSMDKYVGIADSSGEMAYDFPCIPAESYSELVMSNIADSDQEAFSISIEGMAVTV